MVNLPIHDNVSGLNVVWNLNYITILDTIHVKMPTEHGNWLSIYIYIIIIVLTKSSSIYGGPMLSLIWN